MKELYIAPEVEILCFAPVEALASDTWGWTTWGAGGDNGTGQLGPDASNGGYVEGDGSGSPDEGDED